MPGRWVRLPVTVILYLQCLWMAALVCQNYTITHCFLWHLTIGKGVKATETDHHVRLRLEILADKMLFKAGWHTSTTTAFNWKLTAHNKNWSKYTDSRVEKGTDPRGNQHHLCRVTTGAVGLCSLINRLHFWANVSSCCWEPHENMHQVTSFGLSRKIQPETFTKKSTFQQHQNNFNQSSKGLWRQLRETGEVSYFTSRYNPLTRGQ